MAETVSLGGRDAAAIATSITNGEFSAIDVVRAVLEEIEARDPMVLAWAHVDPDQALEQAARLDKARGAQSSRPLTGVPVGIKDLIDTADLPTAYGSKRYRGSRPHADAACVASLRRAGAMIVGKTVTTELALFSPPVTRNPLDASRTPGGSSSGSAAAVAAHMVPVALGTQTAGSVIRPASYCGVLGFIPTRGSWDLAGVKAISPSLDRIGVFAHSIDDVRLTVAALAANARIVDRPRREGRWRMCLMSDVDEAVSGLEGVLARLGEVRRFDSHRLLDEGAELQDALMRHEMRTTLASEIEDPHGLTEETRAYLESVRDDVIRVERDELERRARRCREQMDSIFARSDVIVTSCAHGEAPRAGDGTGDPWFCRLWSLLGLPSLALPICTGPHGLPVGVQVVGPLGGDAVVLAAAASMATEARAHGTLPWAR